MKRYIVKIDESKCNGCWICTKTCISQAIQVSEVKAKLVSETYCDGFGTCAKKCPQQAISLEFREADNYSEAHVMENISKYGQEAITRHLKQLKDLEIFSITRSEEHTSELQSSDHLVCRLL